MIAGLNKPAKIMPFAPARRLIFAGLLCLTACQTPHSWPPLTLSQPGWSIWNGQAVWRPTPKMPELSGDLLVALNTNGSAYVQFAKTIPFAVARLEGPYWTVEFPADHRLYSGRRCLPRRFGWLQLPALLTGQPVNGDWRKEGDAAQWQLENPRTGETLRGYLSRQ